MGLKSVLSNVQIGMPKGDKFVVGDLVFAKVNFKNLFLNSANFLHLDIVINNSSITIG
jgi:hypothetical protein